MTGESARGRAHSVSRSIGLQTVDDADVLSVDTLADSPQTMRRWRQLCPFYVWPNAEIPVPGRPGLASRSVEAVWQGLKIVGGTLDLAQLSGEPHKRPPDHQRGPHFPYAASCFRLGELELDLVTARYLIYLPSYLFVLDRLVDDLPLAEIDESLCCGRDVAFYDWDHNMDIDDPASSFSHSALLARWFNRQLDPLLDRARALAVKFDVAHTLSALARYGDGCPVVNCR